MLSDYSSLFIIILAGALNGSFVIPARFTNFKIGERVWLYHSIIGFILIPWIILFFLQPHAFEFYRRLSDHIFLGLILSGLFFGLGQVCFFNAIEKIGIGLAFTINISLGVIIGSMFGVFFKHLLFTNEGLLVTTAVLLILASLLINYFSDKQPKHLNGAHYTLGWILALITGITSGLQNITFLSVAFYNTRLMTQHSNNFWVWPPFLLAAAVVMLISFRYKLSRISIKTSKALTLKNIVFVTLMGLFFTGSLALYSKGASNLSQQNHIIAWPAFMISIILVCRFWGRIYDRNFRQHSNSTLNILSIALLLTAILLLAIAN